jgi:hypothetical protein
MNNEIKFLMEMFEMHVSYIMDANQDLTYDEAHAIAWEHGKVGLLRYLDADINTKSELASKLRYGDSNVS